MRSKTEIKSIMHDEKNKLNDITLFLLLKSIKINKDHIIIDKIVILVIIKIIKL